MNLLRYKWLILDILVDKEWILPILCGLTNYDKYVHIVLYKGQVNLIAFIKISRALMG